MNNGGNHCSSRKKHNRDNRIFLKYCSPLLELIDYPKCNKAEKPKGANTNNSDF